MKHFPLKMVNATLYLPGTIFYSLTRQRMLYQIIFIELQNLSQIEQFDNSSDELNEEDSPEIEKEDWMLVAEFLNAKNQHASEDDVVNKFYWEDQSMQFTEQQRQEMPVWVNLQKSNFKTNQETFSEEHELNQLKLLNPKQLEAYNIIKNHSSSIEKTQLLMIVTGKAGCGKSFLINRLRFLLKSNCIVSALFGIAAYNINGSTLHYLLKLPIRCKRNCELTGPALLDLQERFKSISYIIIDEFSVLSQKDLAWINRRCKQATGKLNLMFGGINVILVGDLGQFTPCQW